MIGPRTIRASTRRVRPAQPVRRVRAAGAVRVELEARVDRVRAGLLELEEWVVLLDRAAEEWAGLEAVLYASPIREKLVIAGQTERKILANAKVGRRCVNRME
jgi:hypothetical protein